MKRIFRMMAVLLLLTALGVSAAAEQVPAYVFDGAGLLTAHEQIQLDYEILDLQTDYNMHFAIVTTNSLGGKSPQRYAEDYYDGLYGKGSDGILFLLSMEDRDWYVSTNGRAAELYTYNEIGDSVDDVLPYLSDGDYYEGFCAWIKELPDYLDNAEPEPQPSLPLAVLIGVIAALIVILVMRSSMNTKRQQYGARQYMQPGSYHLRTCQDFYLYSRTKRTARPKNTSSGGGSGGSRGGRGGKF